MYEHYNEQSRRAIFFARYEASCLASQTIEPEHLLLGVMREARSTVLEHLSLTADELQAIRKHIESRSAAAKGAPKVSTSIDLPLSAPSQKILDRAHQEAAGSNDEEIKALHILLALLRDNSTASDILRDHGVTYESALNKIASGIEPARPLPPSLANSISRLQALISRASRSLAAIDAKRAAEPLKDGGWSRKQLLGHIIDSASNNHQRFVRACMQPELVWPNYEQEPWVEAQGYDAAPWSSLVQFWTLYNIHLLRILSRIPEEKTSTICRIGDEPPMTLAELVASYLKHLEHHLDQILA